MLFYWPNCSIPFCLLQFFPILFFLSIGLYCGAGVFGVIRCKSFSRSLARPTSFNNNNTISVVKSKLSYVLYYRVKHMFYPYLNCQNFYFLSSNSNNIKRYVSILIF